MDELKLNYWKRVQVVLLLRLAYFGLRLTQSLMQPIWRQSHSKQKLRSLNLRLNAALLAQSAALLRLADSQLRSVLPEKKWQKSTELQMRKEVQ